MHLSIKSSDTKQIQSLFLRLQNSRFFLKISTEIGKAWRKSLARKPVFSLIPDLLFDCSRVHTQKYGLFCSLTFYQLTVWSWCSSFYSKTSFWKSFVLQTNFCIKNKVVLTLINTRNHQKLKRLPFSFYLQLY